MNWSQVMALQGKTLKTKSGKTFRVKQVTATTVTVEVGPAKRNETISQINLMRAAQICASGTKLNGPKDYRQLVADERPAYAWAILRHLKQC